MLTTPLQSEKTLLLCITVTALKELYNTFEPQSNLPLLDTFIRRAGSANSSYKKLCQHKTTNRQQDIDIFFSDDEHMNIFEESLLLLLPLPPLQ
jgi:hypothetical protein